MKSEEEISASLRNPELSLYRGHTIALLRRYLCMSVELGRLPSLVGREFFRSRVSSYRIHSFEDVVILVFDVERCLGRLDEFGQQVISRVILQEHTHDEAARILGCTRRTVSRRLPEALDELTEMFLRSGLLTVRTRGPRRAKESCQEGKNDELAASA